MSTAQAIPLTFRMSPLPDTDMTPQEFADAIVSRLTAESTNTVSFFAAGSVAPSSNVGPWLKDNTTWYVWSDALGSYVPQTIPQSSLGYIAQQAPGPDNTTYKFWIQLDGAGKAQSVQYYYGGAWHNVYEDTFANMPTNATMAAAIAAAVSGGIGSLNTYPARATNVGQVIGVTGAYVKLTMSADINPDGRFDNATSRYTALVAGVYRVATFAQVDNNTGTASGMQIQTAIYKNGVILAGAGCGTSVASPPGSRWFPTWSTLIQLGAGDYVELWMEATDGVNTGNITISNVNFSIDLVK